MPPSSPGTRQPLTIRSTLMLLAALVILLVVVSLVGLSVGSVAIPLTDMIGVFTGSDTVPATSRVILLDIRLPRVLLAILVGAGLSVAGVVFQALLRNPLAEPYILGISSGGTVGAVIAIALAAGAAPGLAEGSSITIPLASFIGSVAAMAVVYTIAHRRGQLDTTTLLLAGVMVGAFLNAAILLIIAVFHQEMRNAFLWLMGNLSGASYDSITTVSPFLLVACFLLFLQARRYNLIATGEETAMQLGVDVIKMKRLSYLLASLTTGLVVSVSGVIGFVGLIIPHICRMLWGPDHRVLLPASFLVGASFLIVADLLSRTLLAPTEIPVGAITAAIGAPLFVYLLKRE